MTVAAKSAEPASGSQSPAASEALPLGHDPAGGSACEALRTVRPGPLSCKRSAAERPHPRRNPPTLAADRSRAPKRADHPDALGVGDLVNRLRGGADRRQLEKALTAHLSRREARLRLSQARAYLAIERLTQSLRET